LEEEYMKKHILPIAVAMIILLAGCSSGASGAAGTTASEASVQATTAAADTSATQAAATTAAAAETTAAATPAVELVLPLTENTSGKVMIQTVSGSKTYKYNSYIITSAEGESVVVDPTSMPRIDVVDINPAAIISTHAHDDHVSIKFNESYECPMILYTEDDINTKDFHIYTIPSSHADDKILEDASNYIVVFEVDGLRIAHMGDIGQTSLTQEQIDAIGEIDIAFMQFENGYSDMSLDNAKGFTLIEQLNPGIIIPTHYTDAATAVLSDKYGPITEFENVLTITKDEMPDNKLAVYHITNTHKYR
jgi:hypothetical protein